MHNTQIFGAMGAAFAAAVLLTPLLLPFLRRLGAGQSIREEGPSSHMSKSGTPTMGGIAIIGAILAAALGFGGLGGQMPVMIFLFLSFAAVGFADDWLKVVNRRNLGLTARQKILLQIFVAALGAFWLSRISGSGTTVYIPVARIYADLGVFYIAFVAFVVVSMVNAVNLTDGLDGLASGVTAIVAACLTIIGMGFGAFQASVLSASI